MELEEEILHEDGLLVLYICYYNAFLHYFVKIKTMSTYCLYLFTYIYICIYYIILYNTKLQMQ